jgi:peptide/nickel transport system substrate-binding protein
VNGSSRIIRAAAVLAIVGATCTGSSPPQPPPLPSPSPVRIPGVPIGGTLRTQIVSDVSAAFDPQKEYYPLTFELFRCCLLRTLLATNGRDAQHGGTVLHPDLAASLPTVSTDGLTWTFHLKPGIHYAPPLQDLTVTSADFIRALEREACQDCATGGYSFYYGSGYLGAGIKGFDDFQNGRAPVIAGLATPDGSTLVVSLDHPTGDLGWRFALAATAPIPPNPVNRDARLGVATGHRQDYGRFLATTGPYMFRWQSKLRYTYNAEDGKPIRGYQPGRSIALIRNPSWKPSTDDLRPAYLDEIDITVGGTPEDVAKGVDAGDLDLNLDSQPPPEVTTGPPEMGPNPPTHLDPTGILHYLSFNLAVPPFDDIHVRKAVNYAIDKDGLRRLVGGPLEGIVATHAFPDALETLGGRSLLADFDPYSTPNEAGDVAKAQEEMKLSKYDANGDGICDAKACTPVRTFTDAIDPYPSQTTLIQDNLRPLGITMDVRTCDRCAMYDYCSDPASHTAFCLSKGWMGEYPDAFTWQPLLESQGLYPNCCNDSMLGASPKFLRKYHYSVTSVPSVDADSEACEPLVGDPRVRCWAELDRKLMTEIVPWVPYLFKNRRTQTSQRLRNFTWDAFAGVASLDHLAVAGQ